MTTAHEIRDLIKQTTTGTHRRRVPEEVKEQVRRYAEHRRAQAATWKAIGRETGLEARKLRAWCRKARAVAPVPTLRHVEAVFEPRAYLREATLRAVRSPGTATLARDLKSPEA